MRAGDDPLRRHGRLSALAHGGAVLQAPAVGERSNLLVATVVGIVCAGVSMPLTFFALALIGGPLILIRLPDLVGAVTVALFVSFFGMKILWWQVLPLGAAAGFTLQLAWEIHHRRRQQVIEPSAGSA